MRLFLSAQAVLKASQALDLDHHAVACPGPWSVLGHAWNAGSIGRLRSGPPAPSSSWGEILAFHIRDGLLRDGKIDSTELDPVCRLAGPNCATLGRVIWTRPLLQTDKTVMASAEERT